MLFIVSGCLSVVDFLVVVVFLGVVRHMLLGVLSVCCCVFWLLDVCGCCQKNVAVVLLLFVVDCVVVCCVRADGIIVCARR